VDDTQIAKQVLAFLAADGVFLGSDLAQVEAAVLTHVRRIGARVVELHLGPRKLGYAGAGRPCPCGRTQRFVEYRAKRVATQLGLVALRRAYYRCGHCGRSALPYDEQVGLGDAQVSVGLAQAATLLGAQGPFAPAAETLQRLTGQRLSERTVARLTEQVGAVAATQEVEQAAGIAAWQAPPAEVHPQRLYVAVDGTLVHQEDGWHEAKCVTCYWDEPDGRRPARYTVRFAGASAFVGFVWALACRCGLETAQQVVLLGDGAAWIWEHIGGLLKEAICIVDWYHALEHVWACGRVLHGEQTPETAAWVQAYETWLWEGQVRTILKHLRAERAQARAPAKRAALAALITYVQNQDDRLAYDRFRAQGLEIGSGRVEAACKHVVGLRLKQSGMRWSKPGSQNTLSLRVAWLNADWERLWASHPLARAA
jgi:hypothetical protein